MVSCAETHLWISQSNWYRSCFAKIRNYCHRNKILALINLLKQIYLQPASCARIYCAVNKLCNFFCHHHKYTSGAWMNSDVAIVDSQLLPLTLRERTSHRPSNNAIWDLHNDLSRDLTESRWFSFVNTTWLGPESSLEWDLVRVQAKS